MAESPRRVDLRLTIPGAAPFRAVALELAEKFAAHVGDPNPSAAAAAAATVIAAAATESPNGAILIEMTSQDGDVAIRAVPHNQPD